MAYERKNGDVSIFKNDKNGNDKAPDYTGTALIDGKEMKVSLWVKEGAKGKFFSGKIDEKQSKQTTSTAQSNSRGGEKDEDLLPF